MSLPGGLTSITVTGTFSDGAGDPLGGTVTFWPSAELTDSTGHVIIGATPITATVNPTTGQFSQLLATTDNAGLLPEGWTYKIQVGVAGAQQTFNAYIPSAYGSTVDLSVLGPVQPLPVIAGPFVVSINGQSGQVTIPTVSALTFASTIAVNAALGGAFNLTLTSSSGALGNPSNPMDGQVIRFRITQGTGAPWTLGYGTAYDFGTAGHPTLSTQAGKTDILTFTYVASISKWCYLGSALGN